MEDGQQVCVECGHDLSSAYGRPPSWRLWAVLGVIAVLAIGVGAGFAVAALTGDDEETEQAAATTPTTPTAPPPLPPATTTPGNPPPTTTTPATPTTPGTTTPTVPGELPGVPPPAGGGDQPPPPDGGGGGGEIASWPDGEDAYTVVLVSAKSRSQARTKAREAIGRGIPAGILRSDDYSSLNPGYWVVFAGQYDSVEQARDKAGDYQGQGFSQAYPRQVAE